MFNAGKMMPAAIEAWSDLFVASAGASAALAGLVFVAISINVEAIVRNKGLPGMGLVTIMLLLGVLIVSLFGLVPDQSNEDLGIELLVMSIIWTAGIGRFAFRLAEAQQIWQSIQVLGSIAVCFGGLLAGIASTLVSAAASRSRRS